MLHCSGRRLGGFDLLVVFCGELCVVLVCVFGCVLVCVRLYAVFWVGLRVLVGVVLVLLGFVIL